MAGSNFSAIDVTGTLTPFTMTDGSITATTATITTATIGTANITTLNATTEIDTTLNVGASGTAGTINVFPTTAAKGKLVITAGDSAGDTLTSIVNASQAAARTYTIPDAGASASFVMTQGAQTLVGVKTFTNQPVLSAGSSSADNTTYTVVAKGPLLKQGANGKVGTFVANGTTPVTVSNTSVAITDAIIISLNTVGGTVGVQPHVATITAATGFTVVCTASDTSTYNYAIISNAA